MKKKQKQNIAPIKGQNDRILEAKSKLEKIQEKIAPFIKKIQYQINSTAGKWCDPSCLKWSRVVNT